MNLADIPLRFQKVWAVNAAGAYIRVVPVASQIGIQAGAASFETGFPPNNFDPIVAGGVPPFGQDVNGLMNPVTAWEQWFQAGGPVGYDATFATAVGGYPKNAILPSAILAGKRWLSTVDGNTTDPDSASSSGWVNQPGTIDTGMLHPAINANVATGYVPATSAYTIGNVGSGADYPFADAIFLYIWHWTWFSNAVCPVSGGRGANARADFAAGKTIQVFDMAGTGVIGGNNSTGRLSGVPVTSGSINAAGSIIGENLHALIVGENALHAHTNTLSDSGHTHTAVPTSGFVVVNGGPAGFLTSSVLQLQALTVTILPSFSGVTITNANSGNGDAHNNVQRNAVCNWLLKL